jgi:hypothetical protein
VSAARRQTLCCVIALSLIVVPRAQAAQDDVQIRAYANSSCIVADEPYYSPVGDDQPTSRALPLIAIVVAKLTELALNHAVKAAAGRISSTGARKDTRYAVVRQMNLFRADLQPEPTLNLNAQLGCMTIVAGRFLPDGAECRDQYVPKEISAEVRKLPPEQWKTSRSDNSLRNQLRRANLCTDGEPRAVFEARFEFSDDGTAYRLTNAGYRINSLLTTTDKGATRGAFYTLEISEPSTTEKRETLSTAWVNLGSISAGERVTNPKDGSAPWLRVPALSTEARRRYEQKTKVHQEVAGEIDALERAVTRKRRTIEGLTARIAHASGVIATGLKQEVSKSEVQILTLESELAARKAEYADLPQQSIELMPVSIEVGVTETASEKLALLALGDVIDSNSDAIASAAGSAASDLVAINRDLSPRPQAHARPDPGADLQSARAHYYDALVEARATPADTPNGPAQRKLALAKQRYNAARQALGLGAVE